MTLKFSNSKNIKLSTCQKMIILFWAIWSTEVAGSDLICFLQNFGITQKLHLFSSNNIKLIEAVLNHYNISFPFLVISLFFGIVLWSWVTAIFCWCGLWNVRNANRAFILLCLMDGSFIIFNEFFFQYELVHGSMLRLAFKLVSFAVFAKLPHTDIKKSE